MVPDVDQAMVLPCTSVIVIMVLLNDALTCATPEAMFLRSRLRTGVASLPILDPFAARLRAARSGQSSSTCYLRRIISSCPRSAWPVLCACVHWYGCAAREPGDFGDDAVPD